MESLVPYFRTGIEKNERSIWVTAEPLRARAATEELARVMPELDRHLEKRQIRILDSESWYAGLASADQESVLETWLREVREASLEGFTGLRISGNLSFVDRKEMASLMRYEAAVDRTFPALQVIAVCSYDLGKCEPADLSNVLRAHRFTLGRTDDTWSVVESASASGLA